MLKEKVFIITGAARGIGYSIAENLGLAGAGIVITDMDGEACEEASRQLRAQNIDALPVSGNVASGADIDAMVQATISRFGRIDGIVNNAGGSARTPLLIEDVTEDQFDRVMDWNVKGTFFCIQRVLPHLKVRGGSIINIASISGRAGSELVSPQYSAAKGAIIAMSRNLAKHLGPHNIRVNVIAPGFIRSGARVDEIWARRDESLVLNQVALRRRGEMVEIARAAVFLASDDSSYMTGTVLDVNGGFMTP